MATDSDGGSDATGMLACDPAYLEGYRAGFEDGKALGDVWLNRPFVVVYIDHKDPGLYRTSWRNIDSTSQGELLVIGLENAAEDLEHCIEDSKPDENDDDD